MHEDFVTYEQAIKLKELGFNWKCNHYYCHPENMEVRLLCYIQSDFLDDQYHDFNDPTTWTTGAEISFSAPTLAQVQKWLREKEIEVGVFAEFDGELRTDKWAWLMRKFNTHLYDTVFPEGISYDTYEQALSVGIDKAIELLKEN